MDEILQTGFQNLFFDLLPVSINFRSREDPLTTIQPPHPPTMPTTSGLTLLCDAAAILDRRAVASIHNDPGACANPDTTMEDCSATPPRAISPILSPRDQKRVARRAKTAGAVAKSVRRRQVTNKQLMTLLNYPYIDEMGYFRAVKLEYLTPKRMGYFLLSPKFTTCVVKPMAPYDQNKMCAAVVRRTHKLLHMYPHHNTLIKQGFLMLRDRRDFAKTFRIPGITSDALTLVFSDDSMFAVCSAVHMPMILTAWALFIGIRI
jgi:hypothetical protein